MHTLTGVWGHRHASRYLGTRTHSHGEVGLYISNIAMHTHMHSGAYAHARTPEACVVSLVFDPPWRCALSKPSEESDPGKESQEGSLNAVCA